MHQYIVVHGGTLVLFCPTVGSNTFSKLDNERLLSLLKLMSWFLHNADTNPNSKIKKSKILTSEKSISYPTTSPLFGVHNFVDNFPKYQPWTDMTELN